MDCVILAAGENKRLRLVGVPAFTKPLLQIDGTAVVERLARMATHYCDRVVIVCAPRNVERIVEATRGGVYGTLHYVVQPEARGPGDAMARGLAATRSESSLLLCGDNVMNGDAVEAVLAQDAPYVIGARSFDPDSSEASALARISPNGVLSTCQNYVWQDGKIRCWMGPLVVPRGAQVIPANPQEKEDTIINRLNRTLMIPKVVEVEAYDIGTPDALQKLGVQL